MMPASSDQLLLDLSRADQLGMLREVVPPAVPQLSAVAIKATLKAIDDHAGGRARGCWASEETLASETGLGLRTLKRAVAALVRCGWICVEPVPTPYGRCNQYTVVWSEIALRCPSSTARLRERNGGGDGAMVSGDGAMVSGDGAMVAPKAPQKRKRSAPPPTPSQVERAPSVASDTWREVEEELISFGMAQAARCVSSVRTAGLSPQDVRRFIRCAAQRSAEWKQPAGALFVRLRCALPGQDPENPELWPPPSKEVAHAARSQVVEARQIERREKYAQWEADAAQRKAAIAQWHEQLDQLDEPALRTLASQVEAISDLASRLSPRELRTMFRGELCERLQELAHE